MAHVATVTISAAKVPADQTNFTVEIDLAHMPASFWSAVASGGGDIRAFKSDGTTELPREVVKCDTGTDTGKLCVKYSGLLSSSTDTDIQIHADGVSSDYAATHQYGRNAVWSQHESVHHFEDLSDSTGNGYDLSNNGASVTNGVADFPASDASLVAQRTGPSGAGNLSFSFCLKTTQAGTNKHLVNIGAAATDQMFLAILNDGVLKAGAWGVNTFGTTTLNDGAEHWIDCDYDGSRMRAYVDGALEVTSALYSSLNVADLAYHIGHYRGGGSVFALDGEMRCFSLAKTSRSAQYYEARHANRSDPATFYSVTEVGAGSVLAVHSLAQSQYLTSPTLSRHHILSVDSVSQGQSLTASGLVQRSQLQVDGLSQSQLLDMPALAQAHILTVDNLSQGQALQQAAMVVSGSLVVQSLTQAQAVEVPGLLQYAVLAVNGLSQAQQLDTVMLGVAGVLQVAGVSQSQQLGVASLVQHGQLVVQGLTQAQALDVVSLSQQAALQVEGLLQSQNLQQATLTAQDVLAVDGLSQAQVVSVPALAGHSVLAVDSLTQAQIVQVVRFGGAVVGYLEGQLVMYSLVDGEVSISELVEGSLTIN